jgi:tRNA modification GTPase
LETIYALSSAAGRAGVAVIRVSGPKAAEAVRTLSGRAPGRARVASLRLLKDAGGAPLDQALVLWFEGPGSFTGEDLAEFHVHGGRAVVAGVLSALARVDGLRVAEPGEFTRRAFENGKLDLTEAEGVADLIDAETAAQRTQALRQMEGALGRLYEGWRAQLIRVLAYAEAEIDFSDEEVPADLTADLAPEIEAIGDEMRRHLEDRHGERLRDGVEVAIVGPPNVGKSSLLNRLARREAAIVSGEAGTTRDVLEVRLDLGGVPVTLADTAGLREAANAVEREGVRRALARAEAADLRIVVAAMTGSGEVEGGFDLARPGDLRVLNKADLSALAVDGAIAVSAASGAGLDALEEALGREVRQRFEAGEAPVITRARHREGIEAALAALERARTGLRVGRETELVAEDLRMAMRALGRITGRVDVEDLLDVVFRDFCIGK